MAHIGWYTRNGHLDFLAKLSIKLDECGNEINSHYVCHDRVEQKKLKDVYGIQSWNLGEYLQNRKKTFRYNDTMVRELESKYDSIPLRNLLWSEMHERHYSEEVLIFHLIAHFEFWEKFLVENEIEGMVSERPSILSTSVLWVVCEKMKIKFTDFINIGIDGRIVFSTSWYGDIDFFKETFEAVNVEKKSEMYKNTTNYLNKMTIKPSKPEYITKNLTTGKVIKKDELYIKLPKIGNIFTLPKQIKNSITRHQYYTGSTIFQLISLIIDSYAKLMIHKFINGFENLIDVPNERYFVFPLHILHEWSNYPWMGLKYPHMLHLVREISCCLPLGYKLYVKEHTTNFPEKPISFYRSIKAIPNVRLIDRHEDTHKLIINSEGIITIGGTMGWEAFLLGIPVVILGEAWYKFLPGIFHAKNNEHLAMILQNIKKFPLATDDEKSRAIYSLFKLSFRAERYPVVDLITDENVAKYIEPFEVWLRDKVGVDDSKI